MQPRTRLGIGVIATGAGLFVALQALAPAELPPPSGARSLPGPPPESGSRTSLSGRGDAREAAAAPGRSPAIDEDNPFRPARPHTLDEALAGVAAPVRPVATLLWAAAMEDLDRLVGVQSLEGLRRLRAELADMGEEAFWTRLGSLLAHGFDVFGPGVGLGRYDPAAIAYRYEGDADRGAVLVLRRGREAVRWDVIRRGRVWVFDDW